MGRKAYKPTVAQRRQVAIAAGGGMSHDSIALALGISDETLRKYFAVELSKGAQDKRLQVVAAMHKAALKGNVAAQKAYVAMSSTFVPLAPEKPAEKPGKKAQAQADAATAAVGTDWNDLLPRDGKVVPLRA